MNVFFWTNKQTSCFASVLLPDNLMRIGQTKTYENLEMIAIKVWDDMWIVMRHGKPVAPEDFKLV